MSTKDKLIERFKTLPKDLTLDEFIHVFVCLGFELNNKGTTSGSRIRMEKGDFYFNFHKPHPDHVMKQKTVKEAYEYLKNINML